MNAPLCPDQDDLQRFLLGEVSEQEIEELELHLTQCPQCLQTMHGMDTQDTLVAALQAQAETLCPEADEQVEAMIRRLQALPSLRGDDATDGDSPSSVNEPPSAGVPSAALSQSTSSTEESYGFLRPPDGPGELGRLGGDRILSVLGTGGMGIVFRAEDLQLGRQVALKVPRAGLHDSATARKRFLREVRAAAAVEHEHVVHINEIGEDRPRLES